MKLLPFTVAIDYVYSCYGYKEYPLYDLRRYCAMKIVEIHQWKLMKQMRETSDPVHIMCIQGMINQLPIYLTPEQTVMLRLAVRSIRIGPKLTAARSAAVNIK